MEHKYIDWKDVANAQFDKAVAFAVLVLLFAIMVTPKMETQARKFTVGPEALIDIPPDTPEKMETPEVAAIPVEIVISDEPAETGTTDPNVKEALLGQLGQDIFGVTAQNKASGSENPFEFTIYEEEPVPINPIQPQYSDFAIKAGIEGTVVLEVDVYRDGNVRDVRILRSVMKGAGGLDEIAVNTVRKWRFQPGKSGGKAVDTTVIVPLEFSLQK